MPITVRTYQGRTIPKIGFNELVLTEDIDNKTAKIYLRLGGTVYSFDSVGTVVAGSEEPDPVEETTVVMYAVQVDEEPGSLTYVGEALPGTASSANLWRVRRMDESTSPEVIITWADGNSNFDNVWDDRASLSYS